MRVLIAGGGTGGHIYPAIAIAKAFKEMNPQVSVEFVGTQTGLESRLVPQAGYKIHFVEAGRFNQVSIWTKLKTLLCFPLAVLRSAILLKKIKPDVVLGVGGFVSLPVVLTAALLGKKTFIWEPNAYPGLANRLLSRFVSHCFVVFNEAARHFNGAKSSKVHMPVRQEIENANLAKQKSDKFKVLIFGGSQGARAINNAIIDLVKNENAWVQQLHIIHQTGANDISRVKSIYDSLDVDKKNIEVVEYIDDMPNKYAWADLVIARAGTGTISELAACSKAAILIPLPTAADDHQTKNAMALVQIGGAKLIKQSDLSATILKTEIDRFKKHPNELLQIETQIRKFHHPRAAGDIVDKITKQLELSK